MLEDFLRRLLRLRPRCRSRRSVSARTTDGRVYSLSVRCRLRRNHDAFELHAEGSADYSASHLAIVRDSKKGPRRVTW